jgi:hypothetical protein
VRLHLADFDDVALQAGHGGLVAAEGERERVEWGGLGHEWLVGCDVRGMIGVEGLCEEPESG